MSSSSYLKTALKAVKAAEEVILHYFNGQTEVSYKTDGSPVTQADKKAEKIIIETIHKVFPDHDFLGEEQGATNRHSEYVWIIDPIDGTKNFARKSPFYGTQLALMKGDQIVLGISNAPSLNECYVAEKDQGAFLDKKKVQLTTIDNLDRAYLSFGGFKYFARAGLLPNLTELSEHNQGFRSFGDCWHYHLLLSKKIDAAFEAHIQIWDVAALSVIVEEAGGKTSDFQGGPLAKDSVNFLASNGKIHDQILAILNKK